MILRRIQLMEPRSSPGVPAFKDELRLWIDGVSDENVKTLEEFLDEKYQLRADVAKLFNWKGFRMMEFGNGSLYRLNVLGNLCLEYQKIDRELSCIIADGTYDTDKKVRQELNDSQVLRGNRFESNEAYQTAALDYVERGGKWHQKQKLGGILDNGSSVLVEILADSANIDEITGWGDAPKDYVKEMPLKGSMVLMKFLPYASQQKTVKELRNMLLGEGMQYETPRHNDVLEMVLRGTIEEYNGYALFEHRAGERGFGESCERERRGVEIIR